MYRENYFVLNIGLYSEEVMKNDVTLFLYSRSSNSEHMQEKDMHETNEHYLE